MALIFFLPHSLLFGPLRASCLLTSGECIWGWPVANNEGERTRLLVGCKCSTWVQLLPVGPSSQPVSSWLQWLVSAGRWHLGILPLLLTHQFPLSLSSLLCPFSTPPPPSPFAPPYPQVGHNLLRDPAPDWSPEPINCLASRLLPSPTASNQTSAQGSPRPSGPGSWPGTLNVLKPLTVLAQGSLSDPQLSSVVARGEVKLH